MSRSARDTIALPAAPADFGVVLLSHGSADPRARLATGPITRQAYARMGRRP